MNAYLAANGRYYAADAPRSKECSLKPFCSPDLINTLLSAGDAGIHMNDLDEAIFKFRSSPVVELVQIEEKIDVDPPNFSGRTVDSRD